MPNTKLPSLEEVRRVFSLDPKEGRLRWKIRGIRIKLGGIAGSVFPRDYRTIRYWGCRILEHRLIWFHAYGEWPIRDLDHINGNRADNRISNLRLATKSQNRANSKVNKNNVSGLKGVCKRKNGYQAQITIAGKLHYLGSFKNPNLAHSAYIKAAIGAHGIFSNSGKQPQGE